MSIKVMSAVWEQSRQKGPHLLLILALADHASDDGVCWPGIPTLAKKTRKSKRQVQRLLRDLEDSGELYTDTSTGRGNANLYFVTVGFTQQEIKTTLAKRFGLPTDEAEAITNRCLNLRKGDADDTFSGPQKVTSGAGKSDIQGEKVTSGAGKGDAAMSPEPSEPSCNRQENHHDGAPCAPPPTPPPDPEADRWIAELEAQEPPPRDPPHSAEEFRERVERAEARMFARLRDAPWLAWAAESEYAQEYRERLDGKADPVWRLGYRLQHELCMEPDDWKSKRCIKSWLDGLVECVKAARGDVDLAVEAARQLIAGEMTVNDPWSLVKTARGLAQDKARAAKGGHDANGIRRRSKAAGAAAQAAQRRSAGTGRPERGRWTRAELEEADRRAATELGEA